MDLSTAQQILVVVLASALAIFLILSIATAILVIRLVQTLRLMAAKAEKAVDSIEAVGEVFKKAAGPLGAFKFLRHVVDMVNQHKQDKEK